MMDRRKAAELPKLQVGFIDFVCTFVYKVSTPSLSTERFKSQLPGQPWCSSSTLNCADGCVLVRNFHVSMRKFSLCSMGCWTIGMSGRPVLMSMMQKWKLWRKRRRKRKRRWRHKKVRKNTDCFIPNSKYAYTILSRTCSKVCSHSKVSKVQNSFLNPVQLARFKKNSKIHLVFRPDTTTGYQKGHQGFVPEKQTMCSTSSHAAGASKKSWAVSIGPCKRAETRPFVRRGCPVPQVVKQEE